MFKLILSTIALFLGVLSYPLMRSRASWLNFFDAFVLVSISGLVLLHLIPHSIQAMGWPAAVAAFVGFSIPAIFHHTDTKGTSKWLLALALFGLVAHTLLDGIALYMGDMHEDGHAHSGAMLSLGVLLHRLPIGIFIAWMIIPKWGKKIAAAVLTAMASFTIIGFIMGSLALPQIGLSSLNLLQALIAGTLLHVIFHNVSHQSNLPPKSWNIASGLGALIGIATLGIIEFAHDDHHDHGLDAMEAATLHLDITFAQDHTHAVDAFFQLISQFSTPLLFIALIMAGVYKLKSLFHKEHSPYYYRFSQLLGFLDPQKGAAIVSLTPHFLEATALIILFAIFSPTIVLLYIAISLFMHVVHLSMTKNSTACSCCEVYTKENCFVPKNFHVWLLSAFSQALIAALILTAVTQITNLTLGIKHMPIWLIISMMLGLAVRLPSFTRVLIASSLAILFTPLVGIAFAISSLIRYDYPLRTIYDLHGLHKATASFALTAFNLSIFLMTALLIEETWYHLTEPKLNFLHPIVQIFLNIGVFITIGYLVLRHGSRSMLDCAFDKPHFHHSHSHGNDENSPCLISSPEEDEAPVS